MHKFRAAILAGTVAIMAATSAIAADVKIGFVVKQPEEPWFQDEWKFAEVAAKEKGSSGRYQDGSYVARFRLKQYVLHYDANGGTDTRKACGMMVRVKV